MNKQSTSISITRFAFARELPDFFSDVHATFKPGSLTILYGPNGVGKSTLLRLIQARVYPGEIVSGKLTLADTQYTLGTMYEHLPIRLVQQNIQSMIRSIYWL
jgi:ABC-type cobalamin/Fe3+-siderophores transport system ATPase subunit